MINDIIELQNQVKELKLLLRIERAQCDWLDALESHYRDTQNDCDEDYQISQQNCDELYKRFEELGNKERENKQNNKPLVRL